jgi:hypothetical protein
MGKIALTQLTSLDGVMQSPGPTDVPFKYRSWIMDFDFGPEGDRFKLEEAQNAEALLLGRVTYTAEGEFADRLNECRSTSSPRPSRTRTGTRPSWARLAGGSGQAAEGARRRHRRLWQPPPLGH